MGKVIEHRCSACLTVFIAALTVERDAVIVERDQFRSALQYAYEESVQHDDSNPGVAAMVRDALEVERTDTDGKVERAVTDAVNVHRVGKPEPAKPAKDKSCPACGGDCAWSYEDGAECEGTNE